MCSSLSKFTSGIFKKFSKKLCYQIVCDILRNDWKGADYKRVNITVLLILDEMLGEFKACHNGAQI